MLTPDSKFGIEWIKIEEGEFMFGEEALSFKRTTPILKNLPLRLLKSPIFQNVTRIKPFFNLENFYNYLYLPTFWISKTPITNRQYQLFKEKIGAADNDVQAYPSGKGNHPVVEVSLHDAFCFADWASKEFNCYITLPSEAEWEKAASWNPESKTKSQYPWGNEFIVEMCNCKEAGFHSTTHVNKYENAKSAYGILDMSGNVWEWTRSKYRNLPYDPQDGRRDEVKLEEYGATVLRGGSFLHSKSYQRTTFRLNSKQYPYKKYVDIGFRIAAFLTENPYTSLSTGTENLSALRKKMMQFLDMGEIKTICFDMEIDEELLKRSTKGEFVQELIKYCQRHNRINALRKKCAELNSNPNIDWNE